MNRPDELRTDKPLKWSAGKGSDVWAMFQACIEGDLKAVRDLVAKDPALARCQYHYRKPLYFAVRENRLAVAAFLLARDPDPIGLAVNDSLFEIARDRSYSEMGRLLETELAERHGISSRGEPVAAAIRAGDLQRMRALLEAAPELIHSGDLRSNQPIHWAVMTRQPDFIVELLRNGADINARRFDGGRPIHLTNGDYHYRGWRDVPKDWPTTPPDVCRLLVEHGASVDLV